MSSKRAREDEHLYDDNFTEPEIFTESDDEKEESDIDMMLKNLSPSIPKDKALEFLHSMASSKGILYWNAYGEMTYHQRRIPLTDMSELIDYAMLRYNPDVGNPRGLQTFISGLMETGINKNLIKNKKLLVELVARQPEQEDEDSDFSSDEQDENDENDEDSIESEEEEEENSDREEEDLEKGNCAVCQETKTFDRIPLLVCPVCQWEDQTWFSRWGHPVPCVICTTMIKTNTSTIKRLFCECKDCGSIHQRDWKKGDFKLIDKNIETRPMEDQEN